jgi:hypothetical protein
MADDEQVWRDKRKGLTAKRDWLFKQFETNPKNVRMGQEIKVLDDEIAECVANLKVKK